MKYKEVNEKLFKATVYGTFEQERSQRSGIFETPKPTLVKRFLKTTAEVVDAMAFGVLGVNEQNEKKEITTNKQSSSEEKKELTHKELFESVPYKSF